MLLCNRSFKKDHRLGIRAEQEQKKIYYIKAALKFFECCEKPTFAHPYHEKKEQIIVHLQEEKKACKKKEFLMNISPILKIVE